MKIYTITLLFLENGSEKRKRIWAYYFNVLTAEQAIEENWLDMFEEGHYNFAVIEEVPEGFETSTAISWFSASYDEQQNISVVRSVPPEWTKQLCNWSIG